MNWSSKSSLAVLIVFLLECGIPKPTMSAEDATFPRILVPASHTALSGDLTVFVSTSKRAPPTLPTNLEKQTAKDSVAELTNDELAAEEPETIFHNPFVLRVLYQDGLASKLVGEFSLDILPFKSENNSVTIPCAIFSRGGVYTLQLHYKFSTVAVNIPNATGSSEVQMNSALNVQWPTPSLLVEPQNFYTYPGVPVMATLKYNGISCVPSKSLPVEVFTLRLVYCGFGATTCERQAKNRTQSLYYEELEGFPSQKVIVLRCEYFGLAGDYVLNLKSLAANSNAPTASAHIKVEWSDEFKFNIHARSIYPCEGSAGVPVLFEYPSCRLPGDRVRVYGRLRADVASFAPPSTLRYITELKAAPGKYTLNFDCEIFTEKFVEYCFAYVSQAITGAMAEVKVACIPTFPLQESDVGGWGAWSPWTPCSTSCAGGVRSRYRFCDTPPPSYGSRFCQGKAVETESCGGSKHPEPHGAWNIADWKCHHGSDLGVTSSEVTTEVGSQCRCGCIVNFHDQISRKVLAANTQACPGRSFWLLQALSNFAVTLHLDQARFPCPGQYFRVRDGDSLSAELLADVAFDKTAPAPGAVVSTGQSLLLEFFSDEVSAAAESCVGGFLAHAAVFHKQRAENGSMSSVPLEANSTTAMGQLIFWTTPAHVAAAALLLFIFFVSISVALQFAFKYRKYHIAEDMDNLSDNLICSESTQGISRFPKTLSSSTLISEVVSLVGDEKDARNAKLRGESSDIEDGYDSTESQSEFEDDFGTSSETLKLNQPEETRPREAIIPNILEASDKLSTVSSVVAVGQPEVKYARPVKLRTLEPASSPAEEDSATTGENSLQGSPIVSVNAENARKLRYEINQSLQAKTHSSCNYPSVSVLRGGKESKDRRNRERLLHGPSSEFSTEDLELDYYDYNVANASSVPGSYLGMDPAFLVWIPPLESADPDDPTADDSDLAREAVHVARNDSRLSFDSEGMTLTPAEYRRMKLSITTEARVASDGHSRPEDSGARSEEPSPQSSENSIDRRARLNERLLPMHRILEDSRVRVSEESLSSHALKDEGVRHGSNRLPDDARPEHREEPETSPDNRLFEEHAQCALLGLSKGARRSTLDGSDGHGGAREDGAEKSGKSAGKGGKSKSGAERANQEASQKRGHRKSHAQEEKRGIRFDAGRKDGFAGNAREDERPVTDLNVVSVQYRGKEFAADVNIPMAEFSGIPVRSPARVVKFAERVTIGKNELTSPDYGVETDVSVETEGSLFAFARDAMDGIKFADEDDECVDNKIVA